VLTPGDDYILGPDQTSTIFTALGPVKNSNRFIKKQRFTVEHEISSVRYHFTRTATWVWFPINAASLEFMMRKATSHSMSKKGWIQVKSGAGSRISAGLGDLEQDNPNCWRIGAFDPAFQINSWKNRGIRRNSQRMPLSFVSDDGYRISRLLV